MWHINDDAAIPPLPQVVLPPLGKAGGHQNNPQTLLRPGCWVLRLDPVPADDFNTLSNPDSPLRGWTVSYFGTLRVNAEDMGINKGVRASGDLYLHRQDWSRKGSAMPPPLPLGPEIPIFKIKDYSAYLTLRGIENDLKTVTFASARFKPADNTWCTDEILTATLVDLEEGLIPQGWKKKDYLFWSVKNDRGTMVARLQMGWISKYLRRAKIDVACAAGINPPLDNGNGVTLKKVFKEVGWQVDRPEPVPAEGPAEVWEEGDLHAMMLKLRRAADLDRLWSYHVLVVPRWREAEEFSFGKMYDVGSVDSNLVPREGLVVAAAAKFPDEERFGSARCQKLGDVPGAAFHNLLHELGHAMGLLHRFHGKGFMQGVVYIADLAVKAAALAGAPPADPAQALPFPDNLEFVFDPEDVVRLRHYPDIWIRPGGVPFGQGYSALPIPDADAITDVGAQFKLKAKPLSRKVPLGAPVKLQLCLTNISQQTLPGPSLLSLSYGSVAGRVIGPEDQVRVFSGAAPIDFGSTADLAPGNSLFQGETLLRGPEGALFPEPGRYRIQVDAGWVGPGGIARVSTECEIVVKSPRNRRHKKVARDLLKANGLSILLIFRPSPGAESQPGNESVAKAAAALQQALETPELRDFFTPIEARRRAQTDLREAARLIEATSLMTTGDIENLLRLVLKAERRVREYPEVRRMIEICCIKAQEAVCRNLASRSLLDQAEGLLRCC